jgi:two-component system cell cycle response regulator CpdR
MGKPPHGTTPHGCPFAGLHIEYAMQDHHFDPVIAPRPSRPTAAHRILLVDDDHDLRALNAEMLTIAGYDVDTAEDGAAAWESLEAGNHTLLITDNHMPRMSGLELLKKLRAARMNLPVIMASGTIPAWEFAQRPWLRPTATLQKPYHIRTLLQTVEVVLLKSEPNLNRHASGSAATASDHRFFVPALP